MAAFDADPAGSTTGSMQARKQNWVEFLRSRATRFNRFTALVFVLTAAICVGLGRSVQLTGLSAVLAGWPGLLLMMGLLVYCGMRPLPRLVDACELAIWGVLYTSALSILIVVSGRSGRPLADGRLQQLDAAAHFDTSTIARALGAHSLAGMALAIVYSILPLLIVASLMAPPFFGFASASRRYVIGVIVAAAMTSALFALWPAVGPWTTEALQPAADQQKIGAYLLELRKAGPVALDLERSGIVSFPSFHVVLALLSAVALGSIRRLRWPVWTMALLICVSTITTGWHYGCDVLGGIVVAVLSLAIAAAVEKRLVTEADSIVRL